MSGQVVQVYNNYCVLGVILMAFIFIIDFEESWRIVNFNITFHTGEITMQNGIPFLAVLCLQESISLCIIMFHKYYLHVYCGVIFMKHDVWIFKM